MPEVRLLEAVTHADDDFEIVDPTPEGRPRATDLVARLVARRTSVRPSPNSP